MSKDEIIATIASLLIIISLGFSFFTGVFGLLISFFLVIAINCYNYPPVDIDNKKQFVFVAVLFLLFWHARESNIIGFFCVIIKLFCFYSILKLDNEVIHLVKNKFLSIFAIVSAFSLFFYCLYLMDINIFPVDSITMEGVYKLENHYAFILTNEKFVLFKRFQSVFVEPGVYGIICIVSLALNDFKKDYKSIIYLLSCAFSLSLAAYLLFAFILFYKFYVLNKISLINIFLPIIVIFGLYYGASTYNGGDNIMNNKIFHRLSIEDNGDLVSYDRRTDIFDNYYDKYVKGPKFLFGMGATAYSSKNFEDCVDLKGFVALDGVFGVCLFLTFYYIVLKCVGFKLNTILMLLIFLIIFYRGFVLSLTLGGLLLYYICIMSNLESNYENSLRSS